MKRRLNTYRVTIEVHEPEERLYQGRKLQSQEEAIAVLRGILRTVDADREHVMVLALSCRGKIQGYKVVSTGTATSCLVHPREVFQAAIALGAHSIIVAHNHPSGSSDPSVEDLEVATRLDESGKLLGIPVMDQLVIGDRSARSIGGMLV